MTKIAILTREESTMSSSWTEYLCLEEVEPGWFQLSTAVPECIGTIYDLIPEDERYDDRGNLVLPEFIGGKRITGVTDGEYLETDDYFVRDSADLSALFNEKSLDVGEAFCDESGWIGEVDFPIAREKVRQLVRHGSAT